LYDSEHWVILLVFGWSCIKVLISDVAQLILFNKPYDVLSQFTDDNQRTTLAQYIDIKNVYPAGRLDRDSEGLLLLTDSGQLQHWIANAPATTTGGKQGGRKQGKHYWVQVEGCPTSIALQQLRRGVELKDGITLPAQVESINEPKLWPRDPPIRTRQNQATQWLSIVIFEGRNRQVRHMTAAIGHPTLRLVRHRIAQWELGDLQPGQYRSLKLHLPKPAPKRP
jgi:23S rRNA pseudouridine2457 synthase